MKVLALILVVVNSRINAKKYFLPMYALWLVVTPSIVTYIAGYLNAEDGMSAFDAILWNRVLSYFALFGLVWPLTIVISPAFFAAVKKEFDLSLTEAFTTSGEAAGMARWAYSLLIIAWIGPLVHMIAAFYFHKKDVSLQSDDPEKFGWIDYLAAFV